MIKGTSISLAKAIEWGEFPFISGEDFYLVKPLKEIKLTKKVLVETDETDEDGVKQTKEEKKRVPANQQLAEVLVVPQGNRATWAVGDTIVYSGRGIDFDLIKGTRLVRHFEVIGKWVSGE
jgi:hypothetical protein